MITHIITPAESDVFLATQTDWLALADDEKEFYIGRASAFVQGKWTCPDIDWDDAPRELDEAVAWYAYADFNGELYASQDRIKRKREKLEGLETETEWVLGTYGEESALKYPDTLMGFHCQRGSASVTLTRV